MAREYRFTTNKQVERVLELYNAGKTFIEIGDEVDIDPSMVGRLARKAGLPMRLGPKSNDPPKWLAHQQRLRNVKERTAKQK